MKIPGHSGIGDRNETEPRILDPPFQGFRDDHPDPVGEFAGAGLVGHVVVPSGSSVFE
jgi:hypothetical protein